MSVETEVNIHLTAEDHASAVVRKFKREVDALAASLRNLSNLKAPDLRAALRTGNTTRRVADDFVQGQRDAMTALRQRWQFEGRMTRQMAAEARTAERERQAADAASLQALRERMRFITAMSRQRVAEERQVAREAAAAQRVRDRQDRRDLTRSGRQTYQRGRDVVHDAVRPIGVGAIAGTAATAAAARRILGAESSIDAAELNTRAYGGLSQEAARALRDKWAAPLAETLGAQTDKLLSAWTDAVKLGVPAEGAKAFAELSTKTAEAWSVPFESVTDIMGTVNTLLTSKGEAFSADRLKSVANTLQHLAAKQSTTPERLISFLQRGAGAAQVLGMSQEAGLAFGSASTSLGNQSGQSGRMFDYLASRIIELPRLTKQRGDQGKQARDLVAALGYGSADDMDAKRRRDPDAFLPDFLNRFNKIRDPKTQDQTIRFFTGREWLGEFGRMVKGIETYKEAQKLAEEAKGLDAIGQVWDLHRLKLKFVLQQFGAGFKNILGEFGKVLSPMAREARDFFLKWSGELRSGGLAARFKAGLEGLIEGLGFRDLKGLLEGTFGRPGEGSAGAIESWRAFARGFGEGLREVGRTVKAFFSVFTGGDTSPETIGKWTARILGLSAALVVLNPLLGALASVTAFVTSIGTAALAISTAGGAAGLAGAIGAAALPVSLVAISAGAVAAIWGKEALKGLFLGVPSGDGAKPTTPLDTLGGELGAIAPKGRRGWVDPPARVQRQSAADDWRGMISPASYRTGDGAVVDAVERLGRSVAAMGARTFGLAPRAGGGFDLAPSAGGSSGGGGYGAGLGREPGRAVPQWYKRGGAGSAGSGGSGAGPGVPDSVPMTAEERNTLGLIMKHESGGRNVMNHVGKSQGLDPTTAKGFTAQGYFQMLNSNWRRIAPKLGIDTPNAMASSLEDQTRVALHLLRNGGIQNWSNYNPGLRAALARGDRAPAGGVPDVGGAGAAGDAAGGAGQYQGLRIKGAQAIAGGAAHQAVTSLMRSIQGDLPGGVRHFAAVNDKYHAGTGSKHALGLAFDTSLLDPSKSREAAEAMRNKLRASGLTDRDFRVIDEYVNPSARATAGHLHTQFNSPAAADRYAATVRPRPTPEDLAKEAVPTPPHRPAELGGRLPPLEDGGTGWKPAAAPSGATFHITNNVTGNRSPSETAGSVQRHIQEAWNFRAHDLEPELT